MSVDKHESIEAEEWRAVIDAPNYEVSSLGRVRSLYLTREPKVLKQYFNEHGYLRVAVWRGKP